jgi:hypothetical protein
VILSVSIIDFAIVGATAVAETAFYGTMFLPAYLAASAIIALRRRQLRRENEILREFSRGSARDGNGNRRDRGCR